MSDVSMFGLGLMGQALANAFVVSGQKTSLWNRTPSKGAELTKKGAKFCDSPAMAAEASPLGIVCVSTYADSRTFLRIPATERALKGKTLINLSSGNSMDAREEETWAKKIGCSYLDGAILAMPDGIGKPDTEILISGDKSTWENNKKALSALGGKVTFVGEKVGLAGAYDLSFLATFYGHIVGYLHSVIICEQEGISVQEFAEANERTMASVGAFEILRITKLMTSNKFGNPQATATTWRRALDHIDNYFIKSNLNNDIPSAFASALRMAEAAGFGEEDHCALIKVLRKPVK